MSFRPRTRASIHWSTASLLAALLFAAGAAQAGPQPVPASLVRAIGKARSVRVVQLGTLAPRAPGSFMDFRIVGTFVVSQEGAGALVRAFGAKDHYSDGRTIGWPFDPRERRGVIGLEFDTPRGPVHVLLTLPIGRVDMGLVDGERHRAIMAPDAERDWREFLASFAGERQVTPAAVLDTLLSQQGRDASRARPTPPSASGGAPPTIVAPPGVRSGGHPEFGEYVYVEELPAAVERVAPRYPQAARDAGVEGTVLVQALVGKDGRVLDVRVQKSIPPLDAEAVAAVRQWRFKPAMSRGEPVEVWVAVPIRFPPGPK